MLLKKLLINYFALHQEAGVDFLHFDELPANKKQCTDKPLVSRKTDATIEQIIDKVPDNSIEKITIASSSKTPTETLPINLNMQNNTNIVTTKNVFTDTLDTINDLDTFKQNITNCQNCALSITRTNLVFGEGNPNADIMIIGEAPGADEDIQGQPFVGRAGKLLTDILKAIDLSRQDVYIANICKCRPPNNRRPTDGESTACKPFLIKQIELIKPQFILALGVTAAETLFKKTVKMADIRGKLLDFNNIKTLVTYHPAALLRNPNWKREVWEDMKMLRALYNQYLDND